MKIIKYQNPKDFWQKVSPHLKKEEAKNSLLLGLSYLFQTKPEFCLYQSALFNEDQFLGALLLSEYRTNANLLVSPTKDKSIAKKLLYDFLESKKPFNALIGEKETAELYRSFFNDLEKKSSTHMEQGIYRCRKVKMPAIPHGFEFRVAKDKDCQQIGSWVEDFNAEATPHDPPIDGLAFAQTRIKNGIIYVLEKEGKLLSMVGKGRDIGSSCSINLVYTPKELRGRGYGSIVAAKISQELLDQGKKETNLYTDMSNPTSNKIYKNIGYEFVCNSIHYEVT